MNHQHMHYQPLSDKESIRFQICHPNNMGVYPLPQGSSYTCSGCQLQGSGSAYVCWQCKVFLHEHCFRTCTQIQPPDLGKLSICGCNCTCTTNNPNVLPKVQPGPCLINPPHVTINGKEFPGNPSWPNIDLDIRCTANPSSGLSPSPPLVVPKTPSDLIESLEHKSHPKHALKLEFYPDFWENQASCDACGGKIKDNSAYCCASCKYNLHVKCAFLPEALPNEEHNTPLTLYYSVALAAGRDVIYSCSICKKVTPKNLWVYYCRTCDYGTEASCILAKERLKEEIQSYKDSFDPYTNRAGSSDKCTRK